jgi:predicted kinase
MAGNLTFGQALSCLAPKPGLVVLMCGVAGSGKTTFSLVLEAKGFARLSVDEEVWSRFGRYGIDYSPSDHSALVSAARSVMRQKLQQNLRARTPTVVDSSFWSRTHREDFTRLVEDTGGAWRLVYLKATEEVLRARLRERSARFDANAPFPITEEGLRSFLASFEEPSGEGELIVAVTSSATNAEGAGEV